MNQACVDENECRTQQGLKRCGSEMDCRNTDGSFECICQDGYEMVSDLCVDIKECFLNRHNCASSAKVGITD